MQSLRYDVILIVILLVVCEVVIFLFTKQLLTSINPSQNLILSKKIDYYERRLLILQEIMEMYELPTSLRQNQDREYARTFRDTHAENWNKLLNKTEAKRDADLKRTDKRLPPLKREEDLISLYGILGEKIYDYTNKNVADLAKMLYIKNYVLRKDEIKEKKKDLLKQRINEMINNRAEKPL